MKLNIDKFGVLISNQSKSLKVCIPEFLKSYCACRCKMSDVSFDNCVGGGKVENYGTPYDFNSIMHYSLNAWVQMPRAKILIQMNVF